MVEAQERIVSVATDEGYRLDGVMMQPPQTVPLEPLCVICVPGLYATFCDSPCLGLARELVLSGQTCIVGNDRGSGFGLVL